MPTAAVTYNVKAFGAKGDGRTDDTAALQVGAAVGGGMWQHSICPNVSCPGGAPPGTPDVLRATLTLSLVQRVIDAANRAPGVVFFPPGIYLLSRPLAITRGRVVLRGAGVRAGRQGEVAAVGGMHSVLQHACTPIGTMH